MRRLLDRLYRFSGVLAAVLVVAICGIVVVQVAFNLIDKVATLIGLQPVGLALPSYAEFTGYFLVGATFFALTNTLQHGGHIRVKLVTQRLNARWRRIADIWSHGVGAAMSGFFAYWAFDLVLQSFAFGDLSPGIVAIPIWIPQLPMALGLASLTICFVDHLIAALMDEEPAGDIAIGAEGIDGTTAR